MSTAERAIAIVRNRSMMPAGHVHRDDDRGPLHRRGDHDEEDSRRQVVEVAGASDVPS